MPYKYIDISYHQGVIDWVAVKPQIDGAILRAGYGAGNVDKQFTRNVTECNRLGIPVGVYWFSYAYTVDMARAEAAHCLAAIKPYRIELPVCYDFEYDSVTYAAKQGAKINKAKATALVHAFCEEVERAGYYAANYANQDYLANYFADSTLTYDLWYARWPEKPDLDKPPRTCGIWQYSERGAVDGIKGYVDINAAYKDYPAVIKAAGLNGLGKKAEPAPWYKAAQDWVKAQGIHDGTEPDKAVTRAEVWAMLHKMSKE